MRKIYSLVLMAAALLIGTNTWADVHDKLLEGDQAQVTKTEESTKYASSLKDAFDYVGYGETAEIVLLRSINVEAPITMPGTIPTYANGKGCLHEVDGQNITLNLNGKNITTTTNNVTPFRILKGSLDIEGSGIITKEHTNRYKENGVEKVYGEPDWYGGAIVAISGAQDSLAADWSVLTIGKDVMLQFNRETGSDGKVLKSKAIAITNFAGLGWAKKASGGDAYNGTTYTQGEGTDFLARKYNALETETSALNTNLAPDQINKFGYATKITKNIWSGTEASHGEVGLIEQAITANKSTFLMGWGALTGAVTSGDVTYYKGIMQGCAFGVKVIIEGTVSGSYYGVHIHGNISQTPEGLKETKTRHKATAPYFTHQFPYLKVGKTATVSSAADGSCNGIYVAGYGVVDIEGEVYGATGVYMKSGDVVCKDANIRSTFTGKAVFNWGTFGDGGTHGAGGSAIVAETSDAYAGGMGVTIQGDTKVTGSTGYAIFDQTTVTETIVDDVTTYSTTNHITIEGGTIESGTLGTIAVTQGAVDATSITGGNVEGTTVTISNPDKPGQTVTIPTTDFIPEGTHTTTITNGTKTIVVVSQGAAPTDYDHVYGNEKDSVKWVGTGADATETLADNLTLKELEINQNWDQVLTIPSTKTLTVGHLIMGENAQIIVEAGGKLIVNGNQGIVAPKTTNLVLLATATNQATFVIAPEVTSNKQPKASVEYYTEAYGMPKTGTSSNYKWDRLTTPLSVYKKVSSNYSTLDPQPALLPGQSGLWTFVEYYDELNSEWVGLNAYSEMQAFTCYALSNNTANGGITYTFEGNLQGNVADNIELDHAGWNYMGNAFIAPIHVKTMLTAIANSGAGIDNSMYLWDMGNQKYIPVNKTQYSYFSAGPKEIPALQTFILKLTSGNSALLDLNYAQSVYNYVINPTAANYSAPQRAIASDVNAFRMNIKSANGEEDDVYMVESGEFSADYDNGADIVKYMNKGINFYAEGEEKYAMVASDNIIGSIFSLQTTEAINYTLTFAEVRGEEYALRDNMTGKTIAIVEGATYNFSAQPNEVAENRFEIVNRDAVTTDINTIVGDNASKAVYTVLGQYVGETADWNNLPAGIYVVDGVKVVK